MASATHAPACTGVAAAVCAVATAGAGLSALEPVASLDATATAPVGPADTGAASAVDPRIVSVLSLFDSVVLVGYLRQLQADAPVVTLCDAGGVTGTRSLDLPGPPVLRPAGLAFGAPAAAAAAAAGPDRGMAPGPAAYGPRAVPRVPASTPLDELRARFMSPTAEGGCSPVVIEGGAAAWPALGRWTIDHFRAQHGAVPVDVTFAGGKRRTMPLREYIDRFRPPPDAAAPDTAAGGADATAAAMPRRSPEEVGYLRGFYFPQVLPELLADFTPPAWAAPDLFEKLPPKSRPPFHWIFLGPAGATTPCHVDPLLTHAWLAQIEGRKRFLLRPPSALPTLLRASGGYAEGDPSLGWEALLGPGDVLFVPRFWAHTVACLTDSLSLTYNYLAADYFPIVRAAFLAHRVGRLQAALADEGPPDHEPE